MHAPAEIRGRVIGVFSMSMGMRTFSGLTIGVLGASVGTLFLVITALFFSLNIRTARSG
jgi:hypothetical protein